MKKILILFFLLQIFCSSCVNNLTEPKIIGTQVWMTRNLDVVTYRNGDTIQQVTDPSDWLHTDKGAWCYYNNDQANGKLYGKIYNWHAVKDPRGLAPEGWHVPSEQEWRILITYLGGKSEAGGKMKSTESWNSPNSGAANESGFNGLPGGIRTEGGVFRGISSRSAWWSYSREYFWSAWNCRLFYDQSSVVMDSDNFGTGFYVRCIKDK